MVNSVAIPQDIIDSVIEAVDDRDLLKICALVSSSFLFPSRKQLFCRLDLGGDQACQRLHQFLVKNPVIQSFVSSIAIKQDQGYRASCSQLNRTSLIAILRLPFCCLKSLHINMWWKPLNWNHFSSELQDALSTIIHSPTLKTFHLRDVPLPREN